MFYATKISDGLRISKYTVGFLLIAIICALPETFISITSALEGTPSLGLGTLFGSNVADLTLIFGLVILFSGNSLKAGGKIIKHGLAYVMVLSLPILFGLNGYYSRLEGFILILGGILFYIYTLNHERSKDLLSQRKFSIKYFLFFISSLAVLLVSSDLTVRNVIISANYLNINPAIVGMFFIALGTTLPELFLSIKAVRENHDHLAIGDILGNVITDATIVVGIVALISPFEFNRRIVYFSAVFMLVAALGLMYMMKKEKTLTNRDAFLLIVVYIIFVITEIIASDYYKYIGD